MKRYHYVVIGAGAGGLVVAVGLAKAGRRVLLIEKGELGGDCTNVGCIPSKALIAAAEVAHMARTAHKLGLKEQAGIDCSSALEYVRSVIERVRGKEECPELEKIGIDVLEGRAEFIDAHTLEVTPSKNSLAASQAGDPRSLRVRGKVIILATGSRPYIPPIDGLEGSPYQTNETIFTLEKPPHSLAVVGAGAIGSELAQAFARLGTRVSLIHPHEHILDREDSLVSKELRPIFEEEGIELIAPAKLERICYSDGTFELGLDRGVICAEHLLIATGRAPRVGGLGLEKAGVHFSHRGIEVNSYGQTNISHIWAVGDVCGQALFTHTAEAHGRAVLFNLLVPKWLRWLVKKPMVGPQAIPRVTFTSPEVASIGLSAQEAKLKYGAKKVAVYDVEFDEIDRAICQEQTEGFVRIVTKKWSSKILGATICASRAGEMLMEVGMAMSEGIPLRKIAGLLHPYPIYNHAIRKAADQWLTKTLLGRK